MVAESFPTAMFSAMYVKRAPAFASRSSSPGSPGSWCSRILRLSISSACRRAALKSASSQFNSGRLCALRSRLSSSNSSRSESLRGGICAGATPAAKKHKAPAEKSRENIFAGSRTFAAAGCDASFFIPLKESAANADRAEAHHHVSAGRGPAEAEHRAEAREQQHLIQLVAQFRAGWTRENLIIGHVARSIYCHVQQKAVGQGKFGIVLFGRPGLRIIRKRNKSRRMHEIDGHIVFDRAEGDARNNHLQGHNKNQHRRQKAACRRNGQRAKHVLEHDSRVIPEMAPTHRPILRLLGLRRRDLDAHREIRVRNSFRHARKQYRQLAEPLQLFAAAAAKFQVFANRDAFPHTLFANQCVIEIASQMFSYRGALHESPSPACVSRGDLPCEATATCRTAEEASP